MIPTTRSRKARRTLVLAALAAGAIAPAAFGLPALAASNPPGSIGIRLDTIPKNQQNIQRDRAYIVRYMRIGTTVHAAVSVSNTTRSVQHVSVYAGAASVVKGAFTFGAGAAPNELTTWTHLSTPVVVLRPFTLKRVTVTISVPRNASKGERYGVIWAQISGHGPGNVTEVNRVGIRMYINVGPGGAPPAGFSVGKLIAARSASGQPEAVAQVINTGGVALDLSGTLRLTHGPGGIDTRPLQLGSAVTLAPGATVQVTVPIGSKLPRGPWHAVLRLRSGLIKHSTRATLTFPAPGAPAAKTGTDWVLPAGIALLVILAGLSAFVVARERRSRHRQPARGLRAPGGTHRPAGR
jgi:hypothetical protein